jgi:lipase ATG15
MLGYCFLRCQCSSFSFLLYRLPAELVNVIATLQSEAVKKVSFYILTTKFAEELLLDSTYDSVQVSGHSLGGGLAMITGAQAKIPAIALSGPNALISGRSFDPPVTREELNQYAFNIIPNRDVVAMLDDKADQFQFIRCNAALNDFAGCHESTRSVCEIMTTCGSGNRPAFCECATMFGFDEPANDGDEDFATLCNSTASPASSKDFKWGMYLLLCFIVML